MALYWWIILLTSFTLVSSSEGSVYDEDYDTYTKAYDYKSSGKNKTNRLKWQNVLS